MRIERSVLARSLKKDVNKPLIIVFALAFAARLIAVFYLKRYLAPIGSEYEGIAINLLTGKGYSLSPFFGIGYLQPTSWVAPVYPFLLAFVFMLGGVYKSVSFLSLELVQVAFGSVTTLVVFRIGAAVWSRTVGVVASLIWAVYPASVYMTTQHRPITLVIFLLCYEVHFLLALRQRFVPKRAVICGVFAGLLVLTEPTAFAFLILSLCWLLLTPVSGVVIKIKAALILLAVASAVMLPWTIRNYVVHGKLMLVKSSLGYQLWSGNNPAATGTLRLWVPPTAASKVDGSGLAPLADGEKRLWEEKQEMPLIDTEMPSDLKTTLQTMPEVRADETLFRAAIKYIMENPRRFLELLAIKAYYFWWFDPTNPLTNTLIYRLPWMIVLPLGVVGMFLSRRMWRDVSIFYLLIIAFTLPYIVTVVEARFRMPIEPFMILFAAYAVVRSCRLLGLSLGIVAGCNIKMG